MLRGSSRVSRNLLAFACAALLATSAGVTTIDDFAGSTLGIRTLTLFGGSLPAPVPGTLTYIGGTKLVLTYSLASPIDLTASSNDAFAIGVDALVKGLASVDLKVTATDGAANVRTATQAGIASGSLALSYSAFSPASPPVVFDDVTKLEFEFSSLAPFAITLSDISAVPEPSTGAMLGLGLAGLACTGRRRR